MGVHRAHQGHGLGLELVLAALYVCTQSAGLVGARAVVTHPLNHGLTGFYSRAGFKPFNDPRYDHTMYVLMKDARRTLAEADLVPPPAGP
jgi:GNAT superfamily N-acetyltransferase